MHLLVFVGWIYVVVIILLLLQRMGSLLSACVCACIRETATIDLPFKNPCSVCFSRSTFSPSLFLDTFSWQQQKKSCVYIQDRTHSTYGLKWISCSFCLCVRSVFLNLFLFHSCCVFVCVGVGEWASVVWFVCLNVWSYLKIFMHVCNVQASRVSFSDRKNIYEKMRNRLKRSGSHIADP